MEENKFNASFLQKVQSNNKSRCSKQYYPPLDLSISYADLFSDDLNEIETFLSKLNLLLLSTCGAPIPPENVISRLLFLCNSHIPPKIVALSFCCLTKFAFYYSKIQTQVLSDEIQYIFYQDTHQLIILKDSVFFDALQYLFQINSHVMDIYVSMPEFRSFLLDNIINPEDDLIVMFIISALTECVKSKNPYILEDIQSFFQSAFNHLISGNISISICFFGLLTASIRAYPDLSVNSEFVSLFLDHIFQDPNCEQCQTLFMHSLTVLSVFAGTSQGTLLASSNFLKLLSDNLLSLTESPKYSLLYLKILFFLSRLNKNFSASIFTTFKDFILKSLKNETIYNKLFAGATLSIIIESNSSILQLIPDLDSVLSLIFEIFSTVSSFQDEVNKDTENDVNLSLDSILNLAAFVYHIGKGNLLEDSIDDLKELAENEFLPSELLDKIEALITLLWKD